MDQPYSDAVLREYLARNPDAERAALHDPQFAADVHRMRMVLDRLDTVLSAEGASVEMRCRVGARLAADCLGTDEANARARSVQQLLTQTTVQVPADVL